MGKIRIKTLGDEEQEKKLKNKKEAKKAADPVIPASEPESPSGENEMLNQVQHDTKKTKQKTDNRKKSSQKKRSAKYQEALSQLDKTKMYTLSQALDILPKIHLAKFDETVELHINTTEAGVSGTLTLPHGTGKKVKVVAASDEVIAEIEKGKINFDILVATPAMMPKLAKVAKILGPKGLMPNPKNGTITDKPEDVVKKFAGGQMSFKTESKLPVMHVSVGKMSFGNDKLTENIKVMVAAVSATRIKNVTLKSTMSPGVKLDLNTL